MATIRRAGFGSVFEVENETVGIGTTGTATNTVQVLGETKASNALVAGLSTLTTYQGFVDSNAEFGNSNVDINSQSGTMGNIEICHGDFNVSSASTLTSSVNQLTLTDSFSVPTGNTDSRIHCQTAGSMRFNEDLGTLEFYTGDVWKTVNSFKDTGNRGRGVFAAGVSGPAETRTIDYINIASQGNAISFGEAFPQVESRVAGTGNAVRGLFAGTNDTDSHEIIEYITTASAGDSIDFGNLSEGRGTMGAAASSTRGIFMAGRSPNQNIIDYVEIMTTGNALDFGDCTEQAQWVSCNNSTTRAIRMGGENSVSPNDQGGRLDTIDFVAIASKGNAVDFGKLTSKRGETASCSNATRGITAGGSPSQSKRQFDYITLASEGNATYFGDLTGRSVALAAGASNGTRGVIAGGYLSPGSVNSIDFVLFSTTGNAQDFGDLTVDRWSLGGLSDSHGGLGGF